MAETVVDGGERAGAQLPTLYGRDQELATALEVVTRPATETRAVLIRGEAGAGKTTIWEAALRAAQLDERHVLRARPTEAEARLSFAAVRDLLGGEFDAIADRLPPPQRRALAVALLREDPGPRPERAGAVEAALTTALRLLATDRPLVLAIDDLQWLDRGSRRALEFAFRRLPDAGVVVLATARSASQGSDGEARPLDLEATLAPGRAEVQTLGPLSLGAIHAVLFERLGRTFPRPVLRRIHSAARGNPFHALELGRLLAAGEPLAPGGELPVPDDVHAVARARVERLPRRTREALLIAAAQSNPTMALVEAAGGGDLVPAIRADVVRIERGAIRFTHPLFASSVYRQAPPEVRRATHARLAPLAASAEERARHLALATVPPDEHVAGELERAAVDALDRGAVEAAVELAGLACEMSEGDGDAAHRARRHDLHRRRMALAEYSLKAGDAPRARAVVAEALRAAQPGRDRAEARFYLGRSLMFGADWTRAEELLGEAASEAADDAPIAARIELAFAQLLTMSGRESRDVIAHARTAARLAAQLGRDDILCEALSLEAKHLALIGGGDPGALIERAQRLQPAIEHLWVAQWPIDFVAAIREWQDDLAGSIAAWEEVCREAAERGDESSREWTLWRLAHAECVAGAWVSARQHLDEGEAMSLQAGRGENQALYLAVRALLEAMRGDEQAARSSASQTASLIGNREGVVPWRISGWAIGLLELSLGRAAEAVERLRPVGEALRASGIAEPGAARPVADEIEALIEAGRLEEAEETLSWLEDRARALGRASALAAASRCRGLLLAAGGRTDEAIEVVQEALAHHERVELPFDRARTLLTLGRVARRRKSKRVARQSLEEALAAFDRLGASIWAGRARGELDRIPGRRRAGGLTPTERRIAELLADGRSTDEVAAALFVTPKTVETYATRVYAKLGVHSRAALVRRAGEAGLRAKV